MRWFPHCTQSMASALHGQDLGLTSQSQRLPCSLLCWHGGCSDHSGVSRRPAHCEEGLCSQNKSPELRCAGAALAWPG